MNCPEIFRLFLLLLMIFQALYAGEAVLEGKVREANSHREIAGVNVFIPARNTGATTNAAGRFVLKVSDPQPDLLVIFEHVAFDTLKLTFVEASSLKNIFLQERVIPLRPIEVQEKGVPLEIRKDIPQTVSVLESQSFEFKGYVDAGDLLRSDHSVQVDENLSGKKTVAIRGGNADEVVVLYNGIRMNSVLDNTFDISLIDLEDVQRVEVIKGSNTSLYGSEAFAGVINIVPKTGQDYTARFQQRIGSYDSGSWGLHLQHHIKDLYGSYSIRKSGARRKYAGEPEGRQLLENLAEHQTASLDFAFSKTASGEAKSALGLLYLRSELDYENERYNESLANFNQMISARFSGDIGPLAELNLTGAYQWLDEEEFVNLAADAPGEAADFLSRDIQNRALNLHAEKTFRLHPLQLLLAYQYRNATLDFRNLRIYAGEQPLGVESADMARKHHGLVAIGKYAAPGGSSFFEIMDFSLSVRYDRVTDRQPEPVFRNPGDPTPANDSPGFSVENHWDEGMVKFSTLLEGGKRDLAVNAFMNFGSNVKFPTLLQQISTPDAFASEETRPNLNPERNTGMEVGAAITRELRDAAPLYGWQITANFFRNYYKNKFRMYYSPVAPLAVYDNAKTAGISGFEAKPAFFFLRKKLVVETGFSRYFFSDPQTFPFKYDSKITLNLLLDHRGFSAQLFVFREGKQLALVRNAGGGFSSIELPVFSNLDFYLSKRFELYKLKFIFNLTLRNILSDDFELEGLALRDRRYYVSVGVQY